MTSSLNITLHTDQSQKYAYNKREEKENIENAQTPREPDPISKSNEMKKNEDVYTQSVVKKRIESQFIQDTLGENPFVIEAKKVKTILELTQLSMPEFLQKLIPIVKEFAHPLISNYKVGAAGLGKSGNVYLGVNLEFPGFHLNQTVHGEQFLIANARNHREIELEAIALSAAPCGHCRQFLNEIGDENLRILTPGSPSRNLSELLPESFGPKDLGVKGGLLTPTEETFKSNHSSDLIARAIEASYSSYAPYSKSFSGVAIQVNDGTIYSGSYLENAAFNPSLSPFQSALVALVADKRTYSEITEVTLVEQYEPQSSHALLTEVILKKIAPNAKFHLEILEK